MPYSVDSLLATVCDDIGRTRRFLRVCDAICTSALPPNTAILRFDVERNLRHHLELGKRLASRGVCSTFYFHTRQGCYDPEVLTALKDLGHEVGYHHECLDRCAGDFGRARELFLREVALFRNDGVELLTVCSHGEAGLPKKGYRSNWELFDRYPTLLVEAGLRGEVYKWLPQVACLLYASDTFSNYRRFRSTLARAAAHPERPLMVLAHLHRWHANRFATAVELTRDIFQQLSNRLRRKRCYRLAYGP